MNNGLLITFEGGEGGGKTSQVPLVEEKLRSLGHDVICLREPGGTSISEQIREVVLTPKNKEMDPITEVFLYQAARAQIYGEIVVPALEAGKIVLMDRSRDSSVVYQGMVRGFGKSMIENLNNTSTHGIYPNITILLDVSVQTGLQRRSNAGELNRLDAETAAFHQQVRDAYLQLANENQNNRWHVINADQEFDIVTEEIWNIVNQGTGYRQQGTGNV